MITMKELSIEQMEEIKQLFFKIFSNEPWNDDWSDPIQLHQYINDLIGNKNSFSLGLFDDDKLIGLSLGYIMHWYAGTEYYIFEFAIETERQEKGLGTDFLSKIEKYAADKKITHIFLQTERTAPAYHFYQKNGFSEIKDHVSLFKFFR
ncbi:MAG: GNAT family N-acetyltransferase [Oscillospiraceae bacterium]|nr:GNAT family N-acetyltransferase [Oscillospiraceae bacterium]